MNDTSPILAATDFSPAAHQAALRAARLAHALNRPLELVHVLPLDALTQLRAWLGQGHGAEAALHAQAQAQLQALATELRALRPAALHTRLLDGPPIDSVLGALEACDAGLLVLGARGQSLLRHLALGSTAERLLRRCQHPLLVVRQPAHAPYRRVLVALDFSPWSAPALALARQLAPHARLLLLTAFQVPFEEKLQFAGVDATTIALYREQARREATQRLHALAEASGLATGSYEACICEGEASMRLLEQSQQRDADLVVLGKHGVSAAVDLLLGSVTKHVLAEGHTDLLISPARHG